MTVRCKTEEQTDCEYSMFANFYRDKRILVTGHTGFKGAWLCLWLRELGAKVSGLALDPPAGPNLYEIFDRGSFSADMRVDVRNLSDLSAAIRSADPVLIFHLAAQPIVRHSYREPLETFQTNALGTANVLEAVRRLELSCDIVVVTTDKCYENREWEYAYREVDPLGGHDVYSMSKAAAELVSQSWNKSFFLPNPKLGRIATARAGNVIGGGDYAPDRIMPDCIRALTAGRPVPVRNPGAIRPWQHVLECLSGYLWLGARLSGEPKETPLASPFNFGPGPSSRRPVRDLVERTLDIWPGKWTDDSGGRAPHEAKWLALSIDKAAALLDWHPVWDFDEAIRQTVAWYERRHVRNSPDMEEFTLSQIRRYAGEAHSKNLKWSR